MTDAHPLRREHRLAAVMVVDGVGYSRLMGSDETGTLGRVEALRDDVIAPLAADHGGRIFKQTGDGALTECASVGCAIEIQRRTTEREATRTIDPLALRIGINLGDVIIEDGDLYGDGINIAARLETLTKAGGICLSHAVAEQVRSKIDAGLHDLSQQALKNIAEPVRAWHIAPTADRAPGPVAPLPSKPSIAELPFENMSGDPEQGYFCDGISEDIITELSRFSGLFVIARNSSFSYRGQAVELHQIARELGVRHLLEGSIRRAGNRVRITAQLIEGAGGGHVWSERYDRELEDIFAVQDEITQNVVGAIAPQIELAEIAGARRGDTLDISAYDLALQAQARFYAVAGVEVRALGEVVELAIDPRSVHGLWIKVHALSNRDRGGVAGRGRAAVRRAGRCQRARVPGPDTSLPWPVRRHAGGRPPSDRAEPEPPLDDPGLRLAPVAERGHGRGEAAGRAGAARQPARHGRLLGDAHLTLLQALFAEQAYAEADTCGLEAIRFGPGAPTRRALVAACQVPLGRLDEARATLAALDGFAAYFVPRVLAGKLPLYRSEEHQALLADALRAATGENA